MLTCSTQFYYDTVNIRDNYSKYANEILALDSVKSQAPEILSVVR